MLLGRNEIEQLRLDWCNMCEIKEDRLQEILPKHDEVFKPELGKLQVFQAKLHIKEAVTPKFYKARSVPYSMKARIEEELDRLVNLDILQSVQFSDWVTPVVSVLKPDNSVHLWGDYKVTLNPVSKLEQYPIPKVQDMFAILGGGKKFSKLDMSQACQQIELDETSRKYTMINTHRGLFENMRDYPLESFNP